MKTTISIKYVTIYFPHGLHRFCLRQITTALATFSIIFFTNISLASTENELKCGGLDNAFGPFDYRVANAANKKIVEGNHFTYEVEYLIQQKTGPFGGDIDYTLRAFPNHPRALKSMMELGFKAKTEKPAGAKWPVWCYFDRAIRFRPDDVQAKMVYAIYLHRKGKPKEAIEQLQQVQSLVSDNANVHYNMGLIFLDLGDYENSLAHAHKAYALGFQLEGLRNRLKRANRWRDPQAEAVAPGTEQTTEPETKPSPPQ